MGHRRRRAAGMFALAAAAACSPAARAPEVPAPSAAPPSAPVPSRLSGPSGPSTQPLALLTHHTRGPINLTGATARAVVAGKVTDWRALGQPAEPLRLLGGPGTPVAVKAVSSAAAVEAVLPDPRVLAVVPATAARPPGRAITVDDVHPLADPGRYPVRTTAGTGGRVPTVVRVTVVGDVMLARRVGRAARADPAAPLRPMAPRLAAADLTVGNLESTLSRAGMARQGGDSFGADRAVLRGLRLAGFDVLSLANNHTGDYGPRALVQTVRRVAGAGIVPVGAGATSREAGRPAVLERRGVRFGFLAFNAIGETPAASPRSPGVVQLRMPPRTGPLHRGDLAELQRAVRQLATRVDVVMVLPHWGHQYTNRPAPAQRVVGKALIDAGAHLVIGGHPHAVQGIDSHRGTLVFHSLGNFVFDMDFSRQTQEGVVLELVFWGPALKAADLVPVRIGSDFAPRIASRRLGTAILGRVWETSDPPFNSTG